MWWFLIQKTNKKASKHKRVNYNKASKRNKEKENNNTKQTVE